MAAKLGHKPIVTILLANGAELNSQFHFVEYPKGYQGSTPLIEASRGSFIEIMQQLIFKGAEINRIDELSYDLYDVTAVIEATKKEDLSTVKLLVENGADLNIGRTRKCKVDEKKSTALDFTFDQYIGNLPIEFLMNEFNTTPTFEYLQEKGALLSLPQSCPEDQGPR